MTLRLLFRLTLISSSLWACVSQYTSPGGEVENTNVPSDTSQEPSEATTSPDEAKETPSEARETSDEPQRAPSEASGTCDDQSCVSSSDCCKGYQCGFDPERSKVTRYCLPQ